MEYIAIATYLLTAGLTVLVGWLVIDSRKPQATLVEEYEVIKKNQAVVTTIQACITFMREYNKRLEPWAWYDAALFMRAELDKELSTAAPLIDEGNKSLGNITLKALDMFILVLETEVDLSSLWYLREERKIELNSLLALSKPWGDTL